MSRIGKRELVIPAGVTITIENNLVTVKGPKGELKLNYDNSIIVKEVEGKIITERTSEIKHVKQLHGTYNSLINNMIIGVTEGYKKSLEAVGVGYKFNVKGNVIGVSAGYSNPVDIKVPHGLAVSQDSATEITISGIDKKEVTEFAANVRKIREPEPYKGKGIRYKDEHVRRKEGKKAA
ncbi:MAG: 50S ribosomal protein L6 [Clostridiales bacterium]|jgi:large subunit ribosomal protein L6|nr:50S ribosomal protein L6 [Clostridiales bacterium]